MMKFNNQQRQRGRGMRPFRNPQEVYPPRRAIRRGISLIEVLISMFVLLFGLMGVAAIFPVASHYVLEGDKRDRSAGLAQVAFEELKARKVLRPETWLVPHSPISPSNFPGYPVLGADGAFFTSASLQPDPGFAFILDPLGIAANLQLFTNGGLAPAQFAVTKFFPFDTQAMPSTWTLYRADMPNPPGTQSTVWPVRRLTLDVDPNPASVRMIPGQTANNTFRLRDDLAVVQPEAGDRPSIQRWQTVDVNPNTGAANNTPTDFRDDTLLARDYLGDYSWLATVVPANTEALLGLAPINNVKDAWYEVSTAVFYKRELVPTATVGGSAGSERLIAGEFLNSSELAIYSEANNVDAARAEVDTAVDGLKPGNWIAVMGVNQVTGAFMMKWYKVLSLDDESRESTNTYPPPGGQIFVAGTDQDRAGRYLMVQGPPWPIADNVTPRSNWNLGVAILPGIVDVYTRVMQMNGQ